ncbi:expressed conserved protein [Echinococcus multilocularis]|uniref:Expressed conserved protein n=1 Tax=Echinococcus multilocularis TaxID=6211 RepID=A0A068YCH3_ECHMU|nr:expressed conserved protein [Echinococcus multilocularis]
MARKRDAKSSLSHPRGRSSSSSSSSMKDGTLRTVYIDSSLMKGRSQSLARYPPYYHQERQDSSHRGRSSYRIRLNDSSSSRNSSSTSNTGSSSSRTYDQDSLPVRLIAINPRSGKSVTEEGRIFVFDSKKYKVEKLPGHSRKARYHRQNHKSDNWSKNGTSYVTYRGGKSQPIYLIDLEPGEMD